MLYNSADEKLNYVEFTRFLPSINCKLAKFFILYGWTILQQIRHWYNTLSLSAWIYAGCLHTIQIGMSHTACMHATPMHPHKMHACMLTPSTLGCMYAYIHCACSVCVWPSYGMLRACLKCVCGLHAAYMFGLCVKCACCMPVVSLRCVCWQK